ncbi:bifunctional transcriptional activator/DNA repair enzyme AdaA [Streptococcus pluranimalium]|uniref:bifunctional transcriptional activator/DNA repair enzyme AdaA n=1 Tax=Streptococcus pluranimalium TaxID=82348 RepID=UPI0039FC82B9
MIIDAQLKERYYKALRECDANFDGVFFAAIKTTGIFCHATCRARKPKFDNCEFYKTAEAALLAGYRPCKICRPLSYPNDLPEEVKQLVDLVEANPEKHWRDSDFKELGIHSATARRQFKKYYHMTFVQYARSRRMGIAFAAIQKGSKKIDQQLAMGYQSASGFNDAFSRIMGNPTKQTEIHLLMATFIPTPIGRLFAIADDNGLYLLEFDNRRGLEKEIERLRIKRQARIIAGNNAILTQLTNELALYFSGKSATFTIPLCLMGTPFQKDVWALLQKIPIGETQTYKDLAMALGDVNKVRAVGNANGANQIAILIPCHRVISSTGDLGGYGGGVDRKRYLLELEQRYFFPH